MFQTCWILGIIFVSLRAETTQMNYDRFAIIPVLIGGAYGAC